jgi:hypothetical protein
MLYAGADLVINETTYVVPPLSLGQLRNGALDALQEHDKLLAEGKTYEAVAIRGDIILMALRRNYPDFDANLLFDHLDVSNTSALWLAVLGISGFRPGEAPAAAPETQKAMRAGTSDPSIAA